MLTVIDLLLVAAFVVCSYLAMEPLAAAQGLHPLDSTPGVAAAEARKLFLPVTFRSSRLANEIIVDGLDVDWTGRIPAATDPSGDSLCGAGTDLTSFYYLSTPENLYIMQRVADGRAGDGWFHFHIDATCGATTRHLILDLTSTRSELLDEDAWRLIARPIGAAQAVAEACLPWAMLGSPSRLEIWPVAPGATACDGFATAIVVAGPTPPEPTWTPTQTPGATPTPTSTPSSTPTWTATCTLTPTPTNTPTASPTVATGKARLTARAYIDGRSQLVLRRDAVYWRHLDWGAPGRQGGANEPTYLNGVPWYPSWPDSPNAENAWCNCDSSSYTGVALLATQPQTVTLETTWARGSVTLAQQPSASNDWTLAVEFNDNNWGYADWYQITLDYTSPSSTTAGPAVLLLVRASLAPALGPTYQTFKADLESEGYTVLEAPVADAATPPHVKSLIRGFWLDSRYRLSGVILIGDIPAAYGVMHTGDYSNPSAWQVVLSLDAVDIFYGDMDGSWQHITPADFDFLCAHYPAKVASLQLDPSCTTFRSRYLVTLDKEHEWDYGAIADKPQYAMELWIARLMTHNLKIPGKTEAMLLNEYFAWNHAFRTRARPVQDKALVLCEGCEGETGYNEQGMDYTGVFDDVIKEKLVSPTLYLMHLQESGGSKLLYITVHSWPKGHGLHGGSVTTVDLLSSPKNNVMYLLNACSACRWDEYVSTPTDPNYLCGLYVFDRTHAGGDFGLGAMGFAGVGGFNNLHYFTDYYHAHPGASYGQMWLYWHNRNLQINFGPNNYVFLGDPTIGPDTAAP